MESHAPGWKVKISGLQSDLEHLSKHFTEPSNRVFWDAGSNCYVYESDAFLTCTTSEQVNVQAIEKLAILSGVLKAVRGSQQALTFGTVYRVDENGTKELFAGVVETLHLMDETDAVVITSDALGQPVTKPSGPARTVLLARLASSDGAVAKALRLFGKPDSSTWVGLYRIYEVIQDDVGGAHDLKKRNWGSVSDMDRFKRSANSVEIAGDDARHGSGNEKPPAKPMTLGEANAYVGYLFQAWLASKGL